MIPHPNFPTTLHQQAAEGIVEFFKDQPQTDAILLVNSCARRKATPESDLDVAVLVKPTLGVADKATLEQHVSFKGCSSQAVLLESTSI
jgi:predicted nucleotidyltransferase